jgi:hypothetical protein
LAPRPLPFGPSVFADDVIANPVFYIAGPGGFGMGASPLNFDPAKAPDHQDLFFEVVLTHESPGFAFPVVPGLPANIYCGNSFSFPEFLVFPLDELLEGFHKREGDFGCIILYEITKKCDCGQTRPSTA